jgi:hypothetical protein
MSGQAQQIPLNYTEINMCHACDTVTLRWLVRNPAGLADNPPAIVGMVSIGTIPAPRGNEFPFYIHTLYSEFNVRLWLSQQQAAGFCHSNSSASYYCAE